MNQGQAAKKQTSDHKHECDFLTQLHRPSILAEILETKEFKMPGHSAYPGFISDVKTCGYDTENA
jgi:hypothetical protein